MKTESFIIAGAVVVAAYFWYKNEQQKRAYAVYLARNNPANAVNSAISNVTGAAGQVGAGIISGIGNDIINWLNPGGGNQYESSYSTSPYF